MIVLDTDVLIEVFDRGSDKGEGQRQVKGAGRVARGEGTAPQIFIFLQARDRRL